MKKTGPPPNALKVLRASRGLRQVDVSSAADIQITRYHHIENGYMPTRSEAQALADCFGVSVKALKFPAIHIDREALSA
jgi:transcriptional regulator with XRE-family HTH domain